MAGEFAEMMRHVKLRAAMKDEDRAHKLCRSMGLHESYALAPYQLVAPLNEAEEKAREAGRMEEREAFMKLKVPGGWTEETPTEPGEYAAYSGNNPYTISIYAEYGALMVTHRGCLGRPLSMFMDDRPGTLFLRLADPAVGARHG